MKFRAPTTFTHGTAGSLGTPAYPVQHPYLERELQHFQWWPWDTSGWAENSSGSLGTPAHPVQHPYLERELQHFHFDKSLHYLRSHDFFALLHFFSDWDILLFTLVFISTLSLMNHDQRKQFFKTSCEEWMMIATPISKKNLNCLHHKFCNETFID